MKDQKLENYLTRLEKSLGPISVSEKAEIITEIKSHVLDAQSRDESKSVESILSSLGEPEQVASKYLIERGLEPKKPPKHPVVKWIIIGFLGTVFLILLAFFTLLWTVTPVIKVSDTGVKVLGGLINVEDGDKTDKDINDKDVSLHTPFKKSFDATKIKYLKVNAGSQDITISGNEDKTSSVVLDPRRGYNENKCDYRAELQGDTLYIKIEQKTSWHHFSSCNADLDIKVPKTTVVDSKVGSGNIKINNINNDLDFSAGSGDISVNLVGSTKIKGHTGSGSIDLLLKPVTGKNIVVDIKTGSGDMTVKLPKNSSVRVNHLHGSGVTHNEFGDSNNPNVMINAKSGSGDCYIKKI